MLPADVEVHQRLWHHRSSTAWAHQESASLSEAMDQRHGLDYDLSFESLRSSILDSANFLHHKNCCMRLFIKVDASDAGWGACAYQMVYPWTGHTDEEGRGRQGDTGTRKVI
jgi:hypothetical protein